MEVSSVSGRHAYNLQGNSQETLQKRLSLYETLAILSFGLQARLTVSGSAVSMQS